jgi:hypothetical protein
LQMALPPARQSNLAHLYPSDKSRKTDSSYGGLGGPYRMAT